MITIPNFNDRSVGRLGNKLFILAAALNLAIENNDEVILPPGEYTDLFPLIREGNCYPEAIYEEKRFEYDKIPYVSMNMGIKGYFQSWKYFWNNYESVTELMMPCFKVMKKALEKISLYQAGDLISIHVRRGDYVNNEHYEQLDSYYDEAMNLFPNRQFLVFSDNIEWCKNRFKGNKFAFVNRKDDKDNPVEDLADIYLMKKCHASIIGNSSYSWWGALVKEGKEIIYPKKWFGKKYTELSTKDLIPRNWMGI